MQEGGLREAIQSSQVKLDSLEADEFGTVQEELQLGLALLALLDRPVPAASEAPPAAAPASAATDGSAQPLLLGPPV